VSLVEVYISRFKYLRVLDFKKSSFEELPSSIGTLIHLRFLNLEDNDEIKRLPDSICKLHNLQPLWLAGCENLERLPKGIRNMISLRSLIVTTEHTSLSVNGEGCLNSL
jgi:Leucine-rich repeat (LRR) protein